MEGRRTLKNRRLRSLSKCSVCAKRFNTAQALKAHEVVHLKGDNKKLVAQMRAKPTILKSKLQLEKRKKPEKKTTKVQFECPLCANIFSDYFTSFRHIQDYHCVNNKGEEVSPTSPLIVRPKRIATCVLCKERIASEPHECAKVVVVKPVPKKTPKKNVSKIQFMCMGCDQEFSSVHLFDAHVSGSHCEEVESLFFDNLEEFNTWKTQMETHSKVKYVVLNKSIKKAYHCSFAPVHNTEKVTHLCPSSIILQDGPKGIQALFHKEHHGHTVKEYNLPEEFRKTLIENAENSTDTTETTDDDDLYVQFKKLMECIVLDAAKVNISTLKILLGKALEMTSVLNNYNIDDEDGDASLTLTKKNMTDDQISSALETAKDTPKIKRKGKTPLEINSKKAKIDIDVNQKTLEIETEKSKFELENEQARALELEIEQQKALEIEKKRAKAVEIETKKANILEFETKKAKLLEMGKTKGRILDVENKKTERLSIDSVDYDLEDLGIKENLQKKEIKQYAGKKVAGGQNIKQDLITSTPSSKSQESSIDSSPSSFNDSYKNFVDTNFKADIVAKKKNTVSNTEIKQQVTPTVVSKRKPVVKTKMGQFKPSISPKSPENKKEMSKTKELITTPRRFGVVKDIEYEVMEQENDCNILILKI